MKTSHKQEYDFTPAVTPAVTPPSAVSKYVVFISFNRLLYLPFICMSTTKQVQYPVNNKHNGNE